MANILVDPDFGYPTVVPNFLLKLREAKVKYTLFIFCLFFTSTAIADMTPFNYHLGKILVTENEDQIKISTNPVFLVSILPGGKTWPLLSLDEDGLIYAGNSIIDPITATVVVRPKATFVLQYDVTVSDARDGFEFHRREKVCNFSLQQLGVYKRRLEINTLKNSNILFSSTHEKLLALVTQFDKYGDVSHYLIEEIDLARCQIGFRSNLGNPDLLVELNHTTEGGWWITGSIEQTLLQSSDGHHWRKATLPEGLSSLISAYVVNPWEIWLAAILPEEGEGSPYLLVYSKDGGVTWRNVVTNDPILQRMPVGWLEGQKRRVLP